MDFIDRIKDEINHIPNLPIKIKKGYLSTVESLVIYPLPGSTTSQTYMNGARDVNLNYEIAMKSKDGSLLEMVLWTIADFLEDIKRIESKDDSFTFNYLNITSKPFIDESEETGWLVFLLDFTANITIKE